MTDPAKDPSPPWKQWLSTQAEAREMIWPRLAVESTCVSFDPMTRPLVPTEVGAKRYQEGVMYGTFRPCW